MPETEEIEKKWTEIQACVEQIRQRTTEANRILRLVLLESGEEIPPESNEEMVL